MNDDQSRSWYNLPGHLYALTRTPQGRGQLWLYASLIIAALTAGAFLDHFTWSKKDVTPQDQRMGWNEVAAQSQEVRAMAAAMPKLQVRDLEGKVVDGAGKFVELFRFSKMVNGGKHLPCLRQETGDCVPHGAARAIAELMCFRLAKAGKTTNVVMPAPEYMYGIGRVKIGKRQLGRGAGSLGIWNAQGAQAYGVLMRDEADALGYKYSGRESDNWGFNGPPENAIEVASKFRIRSFAQVRSWEDVRDAITHGFPVTVASNVGFEGGQVDLDGKRWLRPRGNWGHQMCFIAVEDRKGRTKGAFCMNSWGEDAHPPTLNDEPRGGFWVDWQTVQRMVSQGDSWAYSDIDKFKAEETAEWDAFSSETIELAEDTGDESLKAAVVAAETPEPQPIIDIKETRKSWAFSIGWAGVLAVIGTGAWGAYRKYGSRSVSA